MIQLYVAFSVELFQPDTAPRAERSEGNKDDRDRIRGVEYRRAFINSAVLHDESWFGPLVCRHEDAEASSARHLEAP